MRRVWSLITVGAILSQATACVTVTTPRFMKPSAERDWTPTLDRARALAIAGDVATADSLLAAYSSAHLGTPHAIETLYWRPVLQLQSPTPIMTPAASAGMLAAYLGHSNAERKMEAAILREAILRADSLSRISNNLQSKVQVSNGEVSNANARAADARADAKAASADTKDQEAEIRRLKDELAKSKEELERIKKRLSEPPAPKKPPR